VTTVLIEWCFLTALGFLLLARYSWSRSTERVGKAFEIMLVFSAVWVGGYGIEILGAAYAGVTWAYKALSSK
jgi:hypothetical protein